VTTALEPVALPNLSIGNFASVLRMVQKVGGSARLVESARDISSAQDHPRWCRRLRQRYGEPA